MIDRLYIERLRQKLAALESELSNPELAAHPAQYRERIAEHAHISRTLHAADTFFELQEICAESTAFLESDEEDPDLLAMAQADLDEAETKLPIAEREFMAALLPPSPDDSRNTIMEIRAGTGGEEAALFAADLFRMYSRYAEHKGWKVSVLDAAMASHGGYKEVIFSVEGNRVFRTLKYESGGHRVQRIPVTESGGRIHTSAATVAVLPEAEEVEVDIRPDEIRVDIFRSSGPGGQSVNTTDSAVRLTHLETGLTVQCQDEKSQHKNKEKAMRVLRARLLDLKRGEEDAREADVRRSQIGSGDRSMRIRTYNFPQNRMTDHRINLTLYNLDLIMEGELDELMEALYQQDLDARLKLHLDQTGATHTTHAKG